MTRDFVSRPANRGLNTMMKMALMVCSHRKPSAGRIDGGDALDLGGAIIARDALPGGTPPPDDHQHQMKSARSKWIDWMMSDESAHMRIPFFTQKDLRKRGWSKRLIEQILGEPHWKAPNPHVPNGAQMKCWRQDRVRTAEETPAFRE